MMAETRGKAKVGEGEIVGVRLMVGVALGRAMVGEEVWLGKGVVEAGGAVGKRRSGAGLEAGGSGVGVAGRPPGRLQPERMSSRKRRSKYRPGFIKCILPWYAVV